MTSLLITGGAGFIGSHTCLVLLEAGHSLVVLDNFSNSSAESLQRVVELAGPGADQRLKVVEGDIRSLADLERAFAAANSTGGAIEAVIHFAGLKAVGESVREPLRYWDVNLSGSRQLLAAMLSHGCRTLVFSSSATLYGISDLVPIPETASIQPINPYGHSKAAVEQLLADLSSSEPEWRIARLGYVNPVAHPSDRIGEEHNGIPNNLFPFVSQVAVGRRSELQVSGGDWPTPDGTGVGHSLLEVVTVFEAACGRPAPYKVVARRAGDAASTVADPHLAAERLGWRTRRGLAEMCRDGWAWQRANPNGYDPPAIQGAGN